nr:TetR/AcrR family transcriptional regulator [Salsipaludibacter albus]
MVHQPESRPAVSRPSRRDELLAAALSLLVEWGYEGMAISMLAEEVGVTKAAVTYHFPSKEDLLAALADPLLNALDEVVPAAGEVPDWPDGVRALVERYLDILLANQDLAVWLEGDRAVLVHAAVGERLRANHDRMRAALVGGSTETRGQIAASIALGALWRPVRKIGAEDVERHRDLLVASAMAPLDAWR